MQTLQSKKIALTEPKTRMAKLFFRYSAMNAGKSTALLQIAYNYEEQGQRVLLFTSAIDDRSGVGCIASRLGLQRQASVFEDTTDFLELLASETSLACVPDRRVAVPVYRASAPIASIGQCAQPARHLLWHTL